MSSLYLVLRYHLHSRGSNIHQGECEAKYQRRLGEVGGGLGEKFGCEHGLRAHLTLSNPSFHGTTQRRLKWKRNAIFTHWSTLSTYSLPAAILTTTKVGNWPTNEPMQGWSVVYLDSPSKLQCRSISACYGLMSICRIVVTLTKHKRDILAKAMYYNCIRYELHAELWV